MRSGGVSTGQLYHHLKELQSVGLVAQKGRGAYEVAPQTAIPLLVIIAAVYDLADVSGSEGAADFAVPDADRQGSEVEGNRR
jgi:hypothetical protein